MLEKGFLKKLDKSEYDRVNDILDNAEESGKLDIRDLIKNKKAINEITSESKCHLFSFQNAVLPSTILFYDATLVEICPGCECTRKPDLMEPYLEKNLILPLLINSYSNFNEEFSELVLKYPHLSHAEYSGFRTFLLESQQNEMICMDCAGNFIQKCSHHIDEIKFNGETITEENKQKNRKSLKMLLQSVYSGSLFPFLYPDYLLLHEIENSLKENDITKFHQLGEICSWVGNFRSCQAYNTTPQINVNNLKTIDIIIKQNSDLGINFDITDVRDAVMSGLKLSYDPTIDIGTYLDIIVNNKEKIKSFTNEIIHKSTIEDEINYSKLYEEIYVINEEVEELIDSKRKTIFDITTSFMRDNKSLIAGTLVGAGLGLTGHGFAGLGIGIGSGIGFDILNRSGSLTIPKEVNEKYRGLMKKMIPGYEQLLSWYLSKDIEIVQIWNVQRQISKE